MKELTASLRQNNVEEKPQTDNTLLNHVIEMRESITRLEVYNNVAMERLSDVKEHMDVLSTQMEDALIPIRSLRMTRKVLLATIRAVPKIAAGITAVVGAYYLIVKIL